ncbi:MAG TPA: hypothetical protein VNR11_13145 [Xanthobacteraceae bacterium]|nr:hypothetical protein [Xanthobacteraceae bacterium]
MADDLTPQEERRGTRKLMLWAVIIAAIILVAGMVWPFLPNDGFLASKDVGQTQGSAPPQR